MAKIITAFLAVVFALPVFAQVQLTDTPRSALTVKVEGASKNWDINPKRIVNSQGGDLAIISQKDFRENYETRGKLVRRYNVSIWKRDFDRYLGDAAADGSKFYFHLLDNPSKPSPEELATLVNERTSYYWVPASKVEIVSYPATWVDLFEGYVERREGEARRDAVKEWEVAHHDIIANTEQKDGWFTKNEQEEFARFYQDQFVYIRNKNPKLASIYDELAKFHAERNNLDSELSVYLAALRAGLEEADAQRFALQVGLITFHRLQLWEEAEWALKQCQNFAQARYLLALTLIELNRSVEARTLLKNTSTLIEAEDDSIELELSLEEEIGRLNLALARLEFKENNFSAAEDALAAVPETTPYADDAKVLTCAMLLHRNHRGSGRKVMSDKEKIRTILPTLSFWNDVQTYVKGGDLEYPMDSLMAEAMVIWAQSDRGFADAGTIKRPERNEALLYLAAAKIIDPLTAAPYVAEGRMYKFHGMFIEAMKAYQLGLEVDPKNPMAHFQLADMNMKDGNLEVAKEHLSKCLKYEPGFYAAQTMLGEISILDIDRIRWEIQVREAVGESVDYGAELVAPMKEAAAFLTASLTIYPDQPQVKLALASLYLQLVTVVPVTIADLDDQKEVQKAYWTKAKVLSLELVEGLREFTSHNFRNGDLTPREVAETPPIEAYNILAFAMYSLGDKAGALKMFREHKVMAALPATFSCSARTSSEYLKSAPYLYADKWIERIEENQRQQTEKFKFETDSKGDYFGDWMQSVAPKNDLGFRTATSIKGGKLILGVDQKESNVFSRLELDCPYGTVALFEAKFVRVSDVAFNRGIQITKTKSGTSGNSEPEATLFVGINAEGNIYFETREYKRDRDERLTEKQKDYGIIDPEDYGGLMLGKDQALTLAIRRGMKDSKLAYWAVINGFEVELNVTASKLRKKGDLNSISRYKLRCGFYTQAMMGVKGSVEIEEVNLVYDGGLGGKKK